MNLFSTRMIASFICRFFACQKAFRTTLTVLVGLVFLSGPSQGASSARNGCQEAFADHVNTIRACNVLLASPRLSIPEQNRALQIRAQALLASDRPKEAIRDFTTAIENLPEGQLQGYLYYMRGATYIKHLSPRSKEGLKDLETANNLAPGNTRILELLAQTYLTQGNFKAAVNRASEALDTDPRSVIALRTRAKANDNLGFTRLVLADLNDLLEHTPKDYDLFVWRGRVHQKRNNLYAALADFRKAVRLKSSDDLVSTIQRLERALK